MDGFALDLTQFGSLAVLFGLMVVGELVAKLTKGKVPGAFAISLLLLIGFWTILPLDIVDRAGVSPLVYALCAMLIVTNLGTLISPKEMAAQWKTVIICLAGIVAICGATLGIGSLIFGFQFSAAATPSLTGGAVATLMVREAGENAGNVAVILIAVVTMVLQGFVGYPVTSIFLSKEAKRLNGLYQKGELKAVAADGADGAKKDTIFTKVKSSAFIVFKLVLLCLLAYWTEMLIARLTGGFIVSRYVWCMVYGFLGATFGFLEKDALAQSKSDGILMSLLLIYLFGGLSVATPELLKPVLLVVVILIVIASLGMALMAFIMSKIFKQETFAMCYCIILNAFYGFPINVMLTNEAVENATEDKEAQAAISSVIMPKMLIGGFTSVTIVSVVVAGIIVGYIV